jgi:tripartite-type tricarboxylate transporter receptor subunit TctC
MTKDFILSTPFLILSCGGLWEKLAGFHAAFIPLPGGGSAAPELRRGDIGAPGTNLSPDRAGLRSD